MTFTIEQLIAIATTLLVASVIQSAVGFGMGLFAIPILMWCGIPLPSAIAVILTATTVQSGMAALSLRRDIPWRTTGAALALRVAGAAVGVLVLAMITTLNVGRIKQIVGAVLLVVVVVQWLWKAEPRPSIGLHWSVGAFFTSGVMAGVLGMGGPPLVLWVMATSWSPSRIRAFLLTNFLLLNPISLALLAWKFGPNIWAVGLVGLLNAPVLLGGTVIGLRIGRRLSRPMLQRAAFTMLLLLALASMAAPWLLPHSPTMTASMPSASAIFLSALAWWPMPNA
jgi:uncharacterized membrane protein YfcA